MMASDEPSQAEGITKIAERLAQEPGSRLIHRPIQSEPVSFLHPTQL